LSISQQINLVKNNFYTKNCLRY